MGFSFFVLLQLVSSFINDSPGSMRKRRVVEITEDVDLRHIPNS